MDPLMVISPHLDDAVLSAGQMMAGRPDCVVVTVFSGVPDPPQVTAYDRSCGFMSSTEAMIARMLEDHQALSRLGARAEHLGHLDSQYGPASVNAIYEDLADRWWRLGFPDVLAPLGLAHPDHAAVAIACHVLADDVREKGKAMFLYEELPARVLWPELVAPAIDYWRANTKPWGWEPGFIGTGSKVTKAHAVRAYRSQMPNIGALGDGAGRTCLFVPERFWKPA